MDTYSYFCTDTWVLLHLYEFFYIYKTWIHTTIFVLILGYNYTCMSIFTFITHGYIQLLLYLCSGIITLLRVFSHL